MGSIISFPGAGVVEYHSPLPFDAGATYAQRGTEAYGGGPASLTLADLNVRTQINNLMHAKVHYEVFAALQGIQAVLSRMHHKELVPMEWAVSLDSAVHVSIAEQRDAWRHHHARLAEALVRRMLRAPAPATPPHESAYRTSTRSIALTA